MFPDKAVFVPEAISNTLEEGLIIEKIHCAFQCVLRLLIFFGFELWAPEVTLHNHVLNELNKFKLLGSVVVFNCKL